jgi:catechol 2,3-dioxygenase-like lactoylglutathione lyase family enzyme
MPLSRFKTLAALVLFAPLAASALAQAPPSPPVPSPPIYGIAHIAIRVNDIAASRAFYEKLGYQQAFAFFSKEPGKSDVVTQSFLKVNDRQFIELYPTSTKPDNQPAHGFMHLCFDGEDLNALHDFDVAQGLTPIAVRKAGAGNMLFTLRGPENQNIEYTQYMPGSLHYEDRGKHISTSRIAEGFFAVGLAMKDVPAASAYYTGKLGFTTAETNKALLNIPGSSEKILLEPYTGTVSKIYLSVPDLKQTAGKLKERGIDAKVAEHSLTVTDPDGNLLVLTDAPNL